MLVRQLARKAITDRTSIDARFQDRGATTSPGQRAGPGSRAVRTARTLVRSGHGCRRHGRALGSQIDRRGFMHRFKESVAAAALRENPMALAVIQVDGIADIAQAIAPAVSEQVMTAPSYLASSATTCWPWSSIRAAASSLRRASPRSAPACANRCRWD